MVNNEKIKNRLVSIIVPVYNRSGLVTESILSAINQSYCTIEVVVVDDGSTDDTQEKINALTSKHPYLVKYIYQPNSGQSIARNTGLAHAQGEFIQYLDSDDLLEPTKLQLQVKALQENPDAGVAYGITLRKNMVTGEIKPWARTNEKIDNIFPDFLPQRGWDTNAPLWRRSVCDAIGPWGNFRCMEDWEHDLRAGMLGVKTVHVPEVAVIVRDHQGDRASGMKTGFTPALTRDFFRAHKSIWLRMKSQGLTDWSYLEQFSRKMFWIARLCGERQLIAEAKEALSFATQMVATHHAPWEIRTFKALTKVLGWPRAVTWTEALKKSR
ncbi:glycosyltransferase family 2 protein [Anabaenopsis arnoldii]|nr:glycosyltransferase family 2 protein [Anabaenopsis arnoldii]